MKKLYQCADCKLLYETSEQADKCYEWCTTYHSCNLEITSWAIKNERDTKDYYIEERRGKQQP